MSDVEPPKDPREILKSGKDLLTVFHEWVTASFDSRGVWPLPGMVRRIDGSFVAFGLDLDPGQCCECMAKESTKPDTAEVAFALDRFSKPNQDVEWEDLLTVYHWTVASGWRMAVVEYRSDPREAKPYNWENRFWLKACASDLALLNERSRAGREPVH